MIRQALSQNLVWPELVARLSRPPPAPRRMKNMPTTPESTLAAIDDILTDWRGSQDAMTWTSNEPPPPTVEATKARWGWRTVKIMAFLYLWIAGTHLTTELITGI